ncbi:MAG: hypothetical protein A2X96_08535 [Syntrophobacterales bacterium GWC2_56_13]|nr:MAG: hypothetical protein A2X96_08535 [Syntrophobacterales bacterium GWC2_56_13]
MVKTHYLTCHFRKFADHLSDQPLPVLKNVHPVSGEDHLQGGVQKHNRGSAFLRQVQFRQKP